MYKRQAAGNNIVLVNRRGRLVRPIKADEIQSYVGYGDEGYYAVIRLSLIHIYAKVKETVVADKKMTLVWDMGKIYNYYR